MGVQTYVAFQDGDAECEKGTAFLPATTKNSNGKKWTIACMAIPWILFVISLLLLGMVSCWGWEQHRELQENLAKQAIDATNPPIYDDQNSFEVENTAVDEDVLTDPYDETITDQSEDEIEEEAEEADEEGLEEEFQAIENEINDEETGYAEEETNWGTEIAGEEDEDGEFDANTEYKVEEAEEAAEAAEEAESEEEETIEQEAEEEAEVEEETEEESENEAEEEMDESEEEGMLEEFATESPFDTTNELFNFNNADYSINTENIVDLDNLPKIDITEITDDSSDVSVNDGSDDVISFDEDALTISPEIMNAVEVVEHDIENDGFGADY